MFNHKQRALLESVNELKWRRTKAGIRVWGTRNNWLTGEVCPVCAAAIKVQPLPYSVDYRAAMRRVPLDLTLYEAYRIVDAADNPRDINHKELCRILHVR